MFFFLELYLARDANPEVVESSTFGTFRAWGSYVFGHVPLKTRLPHPSLADSGEAAL